MVPAFNSIESEWRTRIFSGSINGAFHRLPSPLWSSPFSITPPFSSNRRRCLFRSICLFTHTHTHTQKVTEWVCAEGQLQTNKQTQRQKVSRERHCRKDFGKRIPISHAGRPENLWRPSWWSRINHSYKKEPGALKRISKDPMWSSTMTIQWIPVANYSLKYYQDTTCQLLRS